MDIENKVVLVTGGLGCIGAWSLYHLIRRGMKAICFDLGSSRHRLNLLMSAEAQEAITFIPGDLTDFTQVKATLDDHGVTHIVHLAALQVPFCRANPVMGAQVNVVGTVNIFEAAKQVGIKHLAQASSIAVYGTPEEYVNVTGETGLMPNDAAPKPHTLYGVYKVAGEGIASVYWQENGISSTALRPYTVYGLGRDQGLTSEPTKAMQAAAAGQPYHISFGGMMQFQWASDVAEQFIEAALRPVDGANGYNLGGVPMTVEAVAEIICKIRPDAQITVEPKPLAFPRGFDDTALREAMPVYETPLEEGIRATLEGFSRQQV